MKRFASLMLLLLLGLTGCLESTGPDLVGSSTASVEGTLTVTDGTPFLQLEFMSLPTILNCESGEPVADQQNVRSRGALLDDFTFDFSLDAVTPVSEGCIEIQVKRKDAETGSTAMVGPVPFTRHDEDERPIQVELEYDGTSLAVSGGG